MMACTYYCKAFIINMCHLGFKLTHCGDAFIFAIKEWLIVENKYFITQNYN